MRGDFVAQRAPSAPLPFEGSAEGSSLSMNQEMDPHQTLNLPVSFFLIVLKMFLFIIERQRDTEHEQGRGREMERHRIGSRLQAPSCQHSALGRARTHKLEIMT